MQTGEQTCYHADSMLRAYCKQGCRLHCGPLTLLSTSATPAPAAVPDVATARRYWRTATSACWCSAACLCRHVPSVHVNCATWCELLLKSSSGTQVCAECCASSTRQAAMTCSSTSSWFWYSLQGCGVSSLVLVWEGTVTANRFTCGQAGRLRGYVCEGPETSNRQRLGYGSLVRMWARDSTRYAATR
jgi:hypothetical protein